MFAGWSFHGLCMLYRQQTRGPLDHDKSVSFLMGNNIYEKEKCRTVDNKSTQKTSYNRNNQQQEEELYTKF